MIPPLRRRRGMPGDLKMDATPSATERSAELGCGAGLEPEIPKKQSEPPLEWNRNLGPPVAGTMGEA